MAVIRGAHDGIEPVRLAEDRLAVIGVLALDIELDVDANRLHGVLDDDHIVRDLDELLGGQPT
jgi:hypothetical protein